MRDDRGMSGEIPKAAIARAFLSALPDHRGNRCDNCGRRLKYQPGAWLFLHGSRFTTCRSCGFENPTILDKVAAKLEEAGYKDFSAEGILNLPQCMDDGNELQVSKDFTKVFCNWCGKAWDRIEFEEVLGQPISPALAGLIPLNTDESSSSQVLTDLLEKNGLEVGTAYLVAEVVTSKELTEPTSTKSLFAAFKEGWDQGKSPKSAATNKGTPGVKYLVIFEDLVALYDFAETPATVQEVSFEELAKSSESTLQIPFDIQPTKKGTIEEIHNLLVRFRNIHLANSSPSPTAVHVKTGQITSTNPSLSQELSDLASMYKDGLLSEEEYAAAKAKLLGK